MTARVAPFPWFGGKARLAPHIVPLLPPHTVYCEPFGGAASVLFAKRRAKLEVYNDINQGLVTFFRVLRDQPDELERLLRATPYAREEYERACESIDDAALPDVERARRWYVAASQSWGAIVGGGWAYQRNARSQESPNGTGRVRAHAFVSAVDLLPQFAERLRGVQVDQRPWDEAFDLYDGPQALLYLDPPYHPDTRPGGAAYQHELTGSQHAEIVERAIAATGSIILSGYDHPTYAALDAAGFERVEIPHYKMASTKRGQPRDRVTEVIWRRVAAFGDRQQSLLAEASR